MDRLPKWADVVLVPLVSLIFAAAISAIVIKAIGQSPSEALKVMVEGSLMSAYGWGYTLYYTTSFIFTGLAVTIAFHAGMFNIGGEGQAQLGGLGVALACLMIPWPHWSVALMAASVRSRTFSLANRVLRWDLTVSSEMHSCAPISLLLRPRTSRCNTSCSRCVSAGRCARSASRSATSSAAGR